MRNIIDLTGQRFGRWVVIGMGPTQVSEKGNRKLLWRCRCDCGNEANVAGGNLRRGKSMSCGCLQRERARENTAKRNEIHGCTNTRLFRIWTGIKTRCFDKNDKAYESYGGRGITMCSEWRDDFTKFRDWALANGYADNLTCDRINNDKGYSPNNCRWATYRQQGRNTRRNTLLTIGGETLAAAECADRNGISKDLVYARLKKGWSPEEAVSVKPNEREEKPGKYQITYNGETHTLATWAKILNVPRRNLYQRVYLCGWPVERAFTEPVDAKKGKRSKR